MSQIEEVTKGQENGMTMVKNDVSYTFHALVTGDRNGWQRWLVRDGCINRDDSLHAA
jgi:hypothetical protein